MSRHAVWLGACYNPQDKEERAEQDTAGLRLPPEERHEAAYGADAALMHTYDEPRESHHAGECEQKGCPDYHQQGVNST